MKALLNLFFIVLIFVNHGFCQQHKIIDPQEIHACMYGEKNNAWQVCLAMRRNSISSNAEAEEIVDRILAPIGLKRNFVLVPCSGIRNCAAVMINLDPIRYIVYDNDFLEAIEQKAATSWTNLSILAHEVGHHLNGHPLTRKNIFVKRDEELEADEFSGFILAKLGATIDEAFAAMNNLSHPSCEMEVYSDHPCKEKRLNAIKTGWEKAKGAGEVLLPSIKKDPIDPTTNTSKEWLMAILNDKPNLFNNLKSSRLKRSNEIADTYETNIQLPELFKKAEVSIFKKFTKLDLVSVSFNTKEEAMANYLQLRKVLVNALELKNIAFHFGYGSDSSYNSTFPTTSVVYNTNLRGQLSDFSISVLFPSEDEEIKHYTIFFHSTEYKKP